jgi:hypothetical protein
MKTPKKPVPTKKVVVRIPIPLHDEMCEVAAEQGWSVNAEVIYRLRTHGIDKTLKSLLEENAEMKAMIKELHSIATEK